MSDYTIDMRDVRFMLFEVLGLEKLAEMAPFNDEELGQGKEMYDMILDEAYKVAREKIGPVNEPGDREGVKIVDGKVVVPEVYRPVYKFLCENNWVAPSAPAEYGGIGLPETLGMAVSEITSGACIALMMTPGLTLGAANLVKVFGSDEMKEKYLEAMYSGRWGGTMCITEESAGSDVGASRTKALPLDDGTFHIEGSKIFISSGDHDLTENIIHMVLARTPNAPKGVKGLSLFLVPKFLVNDDGSLGEYNEVRCSSVEEKLGIHGSPTCTLEFGQDDKPCRGYLIGEEQKGMKMMFQMMNEARLYVGLQALSQASLATELGIQYAEERLQGSSFKEFKNPDAPKVPIIDHPDVRRMIMINKAYTEAMRSLLYSTAYYTDLAHNAEDEKVREKNQMLLELMVPICKSWCSDMSFRVTENAIQIHGGYGFCREYPVEQLMRDVKITSIYEGTNGIQALDLLGRQVPGKGGLRLMTLLQEMNAWVAEHKDHEQLGDLVKEVDQGKNKLAEVAFSFAGAMRKNPGAVLASAVPFMNMFGDVMGAYHLVHQALIADVKLREMAGSHGAADDQAIIKLANDNPEIRFYWNKTQTARFFVKNILPNIEAHMKSIKAGDSSCLDAVFAS